MEKKEIKVRLSTVIFLFIIAILIVALVTTYYLGFVKEDKVLEKTENKIDNLPVTETQVQQNEKNENVTSESKGEKIIQFDTEFYKLKDIAKEYRLSEKITNYKEFNYDLDGDSVNDKITIEKNKNDEESYIFKLNDNKFAEHWYKPEIYIVDLNENDDDNEVVIFDNGPSDDPNYTIYAKKDNKMVELKIISGSNLLLDKKGSILIHDSYNGITIPKIYFNYYTINNSIIEDKSLNVEKIENFKIKAENLFFSEDYNNMNKFYQDFDSANVEKSLQKFKIEELNKTTTFKILDFNVVKNEDGIVDYKIYVQLVDGRNGYVFHLQLAG